jgi:hypothetical protein
LSGIGVPNVLLMAPSLGGSFLRCPYCGLAEKERKYEMLWISVTTNPLPTQARAYVFWS